MTGRPERSTHYQPIADYGIIGNLTSTALVARDGSIDWCCLPRLDSPSVFGALVDARRGGYFQIRPAGPPEAVDATQHYLEATNVLTTVFEVDGGCLEICDFMPTGPTLDCNAEVDDRPELYRIIRCTHGRVDVDVSWAPRHNYGSDPTTIGAVGDGFVASGGDAPLGLAGLDEGRLVDTDNGPAVTARLSMARGDEQILSTRWADDEPAVETGDVHRLLDETIDVWRGWVGQFDTGIERPWAGRWEQKVRRSELVLKLMARRNSGALAAAPTTSLPETIGGPRNWDYRFTWVRDAAQIAQALFALGHRAEATQFIKWTETMTCEADEYAEEGLQIMYPLYRDTELTERTLDHLEGYQQSSPVRIGNAAVDQLQLDVYGELLNAIYEQLRLGEPFDDDISAFLCQIVDEAGRTWRHPDFGIWEHQNGPFHLVYSKMMAWVALDRACWLHETGCLDGDVDSWQRLMAEIRDQILDYGWRDDPGTFVQRFGATDAELDAANLLMPLMEFLPADDPRVQQTIDRTIDELVVNDLVYRYRGHDGLPGEEGAFALCTCWLVDALALSNRLDEALRIYEGLLDRTNHLGLLSEQIDPYSGEFLGNFPQAYSHLGVVNSALYLSAREGREIPISPLLGMRDDD